MTALLDTSVLVRYITAEGDLGPAARSIIDSHEELILAPVALAEVGYVLSSNYGRPRQDVVDTLIALVRRENIRVLGLDRQLTIDALLFCRPSGRVSFADALIWAAARGAGDLPIYSFDARFPDVQVEVRRAPPDQVPGSR